MHLVHSDQLVDFLGRIQAAFGARPDLETVLVDVLQSSNRRMRTTDVVREVVKGRGLAVTPDEIHENLHRNQRFAMHGKGWWRLIEEESRTHDTACAGGASS